MTLISLSSRGLGWRPDLPDPRDYTPEDERVLDLLRGLKPLGPLPRSVDWREYSPGRLDRGGAATSVGCACLALVQYFECRARGRIIEPSVQFVHQTARRLLRARGDGGEEIRTTLKTMVRFGIPDACHWPYDPATLESDADAFAFAAARRFPGLRYLRLDPPGKTGDEVLKAVKTQLAAGFACVFGFSVCTSFSAEAEIPFPTVFDRVLGGQAAIALGYDDACRIRSCKGALHIANSCGPAWGDAGFASLPYAFVRERLASDFWTLLQPDWLASGEFQRPRN